MNATVAKIAKRFAAYIHKNYFKTSIDFRVLTIFAYCIIAFAWIFFYVVARLEWMLYFSALWILAAFHHFERLGFELLLSEDRNKNDNKRNT